MSRKTNFFRRDFIKTTVLGLGAAFLAACERALGVMPTSSPTLTVTSTNTNTPPLPPAATNTPPATQTPTETSTPTAIPCFKLLTPENGAILSTVDKVTFSWEAMLGAENYQLQITLPSGQSIAFDTKSLSRDQYLEALKMAGQFQWQVIAFDENSAVICVAEPFTFEKEKAPAQNNGGEGGGGDTAGGDGIGGGAPGGGAPGGGQPG